MRFRTRLTLWYAAILFVSTLLISVMAYRELARDVGSSPSANHAEEEEHEKNEVTTIILLCGLPAAGVGLIGGWWLMRKALAPMAALTRAASAVNERNLRERLPRSGNGDEFDQLAEVFNVMTARLADSFDRIRQFTLHASHELKTPLTVMQAELETALLEVSNPAERERITSQLDEVQRLTKIVEGLTLLTKADAGQIHLERKPIHLEELVNDLLEDARILAQPAGIAIKLEVCEAVAIVGDRHRIRQLLLNLMDNAIKYNQSGGRVSVQLWRRESNAELQITNSGPGLALELQPKVFDHFFRGDPSHNNEVEGCGLGLSIAKWIVTAHGGTISFRSVPNQETVVTVLLPCLQASDH